MKEIARAVKVVAFLLALCANSSVVAVLALVLIGLAGQMDAATSLFDGQPADTVRQLGIAVVLVVVLIGSVPSYRLAQSVGEHIARSPVALREFVLHWVCGNVVAWVGCWISESYLSPLGMLGFRWVWLVAFASPLAALHFAKSDYERTHVLPAKREGEKRQAEREKQAADRARAKKELLLRLRAAGDLIDTPLREHVVCANHHRTSFGGFYHEVHVTEYDREVDWRGDRRIERVVPYSDTVRHFRCPGCGTDLWRFEREEMNEFTPCSECNLWWRGGPPSAEYRIGVEPGPPCPVCTQ
jgi:hypothetical protein